MVLPVVIITGAGRGIGQAVAIELARRGWNCALAARSQSELNVTARLSATTGGQCRSLVVPTDVSRFDQISELVEKTLSAFGRIDAIVNNAGLGLARSIEEITLDEWRATIDVNLSSALYLCKAVWPRFKQQKSGVIVNLTSPAARDPFPGLGFYGVAKAGVNLLTLELARQGEAHGIRTFAVSPAATETTMLRSIISESQLGKDKTLAPLDVARVIADCVTGERKYSSGDVIYVKR